VTTPSHVAALYRFDGGASAQMTLLVPGARFRVLLEVTGPDGP
jgi:hypothetical protein